MYKSQLALAKDLAKEWHKHQKYAGESYYKSHILEVLAEVEKVIQLDKHKNISPTLAETIRVVAVLHDILEDTSIHPDVIETTFGNFVLAQLKVLTRDPNDSYAEYIDSFRYRGAYSPAFIVKEADLKVNMEKNRNLITKTRFDKYSLALELLRIYKTEN